MRVLHGPTNIGNQPWILSRAERALGLESQVVTLTPPLYGYQADRILEAPPPKTLAGQIKARYGRAALVLGFDVLHYYFGQSFYYRIADPEWRFNFADLKLARAFGKRIIMTLQGCDIRMAGLSNARNEVTMCREGACSYYRQCVAVQDQIRLRLARQILPLCDRVFFLNPDLAASSGTGEFLPYANVDLDTVVPSHKRGGSRPLIVHAPTSLSIKGSAAIAAALGKLSASYEFDFRTVTGVPHLEALKIYAEADLVIDQILAGWYGGVAVEAMAMGKPVAAYIREDDLGIIPEQMRNALPILRIDPRHIEEDIAGILNRRAQWPEIGMQSRKFVERWHSPKRIAAALSRIYRDPRAPLAI